MNKTTLTVIVLLTLGASPPVISEVASLEEMRQRCQEAREEKIAPLRQAAIEECVAIPRSSRTRADCERINRNFGEGGGTVTGGFRTGMFNDLPACAEYFEAQNNQRDSGSRR